MKSLSTGRRVGVGLALACAAVGCATDAGAGPDRGGSPDPGAGRTTIRLAYEGGQTGSEGSCQIGRSDALGFSSEDLRALVEGTHRGTLGYIQAIPPLPRLDVSAEPQRDMQVNVRFLGEARTHLDCGGRMDQDVEVTLAFDEPELDVIFEQTVSAFSTEIAVFQIELGAEVIEAMQLPGVPEVRNASTLILAFTPQGLRGRIQLNDTCGGMLVVPDDARCEQPFRPEVDVEQPVYGVRPTDVVQAALQALSAQEDLPLQWDDGSSSTLSVEILEQPSYACGDWATLAEIKSDAKFEAPLRVRLRTADGRMDLAMPARVSWTVFPEQGYQGKSGWDGGWVLSAWNVFPPSVLRENGALTGFALPDDRGVELRFGVHVDAEQRLQWKLDIEANSFLAEVAPAGTSQLPEQDNIACFGNDSQPVASAQKPSSVP
ncbi:MAG TPA: hypothetical protein VFZ61_33560 [Polyangiales bacterium]